MDLDQPPKRSSTWVRGAILSTLGVVVGAIAFALFCHAFGLNFSDEGWAENHDPWETSPGSLIGSFLGFAIAILLFWFGFFQTTDRN